MYSLIYILSYFEGGGRSFYGGRADPPNNCRGNTE